MSRRSNLNTLRSEFSWGSDWTNKHYYTELVLMDIKITEYLIGLFYILKMPTSNYIIRRYFNELVLIETDVFLFGYKRLIHFVDLKYIFFYVLTKIKYWILKKMKVSPYRRILSNYIFFKRIIYKKIHINKKYTVSFGCKSLNLHRVSRNRKAGVLDALLGRHYYNLNRLNYFLRIRIAGISASNGMEYNFK